MKELIERLGPYAYCDNIIANMIENLDHQAGLLGFTQEERDYTVTMEKRGDTLDFSVRLYVDGTGWISHSKSVKLISPNQK